MPGAENGFLLTQIPQLLPSEPAGLQNAAVEALFYCGCETAQTATNEKVDEIGQ